MNRRQFVGWATLLPIVAQLSPFRGAYGAGRGVASVHDHPTAVPRTPAAGEIATATEAIPAAIIAMKGTPRGEKVWFEPQGIWVPVGGLIRFVNLDPANVHTATAFHPDLYGRPRRIPEGVDPWHSELLLPQQHYDLVLTVPGVYDYYCVPHAAHGMTGRIVVGSREDVQWKEEDYHHSTQVTGMPGTFPEVKDLLAQRDSNASKRGPR